MSTSSLDLSRTYTSFSGVDIKAVVGGTIVGNLQAISYAIQREKAPIYVMGRVDPLSFSRGKRGIAGTMISLMLDEHLVFAKPFNAELFVGDLDAIRPDPTSTDFNDALADGTGGREDDLLNPGIALTMGSLDDANAVMAPWMVDQIRPFDVVIVAMNEYGMGAQMRIYGIEILNEGSGFSIDDIVIENQMTYVARTVLPWQKLGSWDLSGGGGGFTA
jgi:hypothetical protein